MSEVTIQLTERRDASRKQTGDAGILQAAIGTRAPNAERPVKTKEQIAKGRMQFISCCVPLFLAGWNDGSLGPLLPRIQSVYDINSTTVSLLFVLSCLVFSASSKIYCGHTEPIQGIYLWRISERTLIKQARIRKGSLLQLVAFALMAPALPFPALVTAYAINSAGAAIQDAQANGFVASFDTNSEVKMGILHAVYGAGALCSPLVSTQFAQTKHWSYHYLTSLGLAVINTVVLVLVFRFKTQDECLTDMGQVLPEHPISEQHTNQAGFRQILSYSAVHSLACYILVYVGIEVTIGGWIVTYIITERQGGPSSGNESCGSRVASLAPCWIHRLDKFAQQKHWSFHYLASLGLAVINTTVLIATFRFKRQEVCLEEAGQVIPQRGATGTDQSHTEKGKFRQILRHKTVQLLAFYILVYVGVEVTIGGWIVTYIIQERHGGPSSGYISAGFFAGLMTGRVVLLWVNEKVGERRVIFIYAALAIGLELIIWFVPSLIGDAVAVSIVGVLLGPMYPIAMNHAGRVLPPWILTGSIGWIAGFGQTGSALLPFMTGAISNKYGIKSLQPL
ncbi:hypothetical protein H0H93_014050 [Arthromyces matolae]|nr:hypothetical protein H0H93_014050 [Arthromyces matolae]